MTRLWNDPAAFADEMIDGFVAANGRYVRRVPGGVVRSTVVPDGQVAVVIGGGSGHYPAFGGLVGQGLAHGAAMGNLFASPSTQQIVAVAKAAEHGGGVFFSYGNYAGDVLNFDAAQDRLRAEGIDAATVTVTDDIFSASPAEKHKRRGIAGDLTVFRIAAAAAEAGADLGEVTRLAALANERTRSFGVAFTGCTLPGAEAPLFSVPRVAWPSVSASTANRASMRPASPPPTASPSCWWRGCSTSCPRASRRRAARESSRS
jgi:dihydroxyacetone kinase